MAFGPALNLPFAEKAPSDRYEGKMLSKSLAAVAGTTVVGNMLVAPSAKAVKKSNSVEFKTSPCARKVGIEAHQRDGVNWSLFFSSLRAV